MKIKKIYIGFYLTMDESLRQFFKAMPIFDGHFWVERDGQIKDYDFSEEDEYIRRQNRTTKEKKYHEAPEIVQKVFIVILEKALTFELQKVKLMDSGEKMYAETIFNMMEKANNEEELKQYTPRFDYCYLNAYKEWKTNGGRLVFGSQGYVKKDKSVWWEYGNPEWKNIKEFMK
jgi:hypothetical protein